MHFRIDLSFRCVSNVLTMSVHTVSGLEIYFQLTGVPTRNSRQLQHSLRASRDRMIAGEDYLPVSACIPVRRAIFRSFVMVP